MSSWSEFIWGKTTPPKPPPEVENLPSYDTFNGLAPQFQLKEEHPPDHIFPEEVELIEQVRSQLPEAKLYPSRYILIFLFARRHSVPHSVKLLAKHLSWLKSMGLQEVTEENPYPFTPDQLSEEERRVAFEEGPLLYKHILYDRKGRMLQIVRPRCWIPGKISVQRYLSTVIWWYYYSFQHVPIAAHRNGISVIIDMKDMGWANLDFSPDIQQFISTSVTCLPGRMRQAWIVNSNWILSTAWSLLSLILSAKLLSRMQAIDIVNLEKEIDKQYIPTELGGDWKVDIMKDWYDKVIELDNLLKEKKKSIL